MDLMLFVGIRVREFCFPFGHTSYYIMLFESEIKTLYIHTYF